MGVAFVVIINIYLTFFVLIITFIYSTKDIIKKKIPIINTKAITFNKKYPIIENTIPKHNWIKHQIFSYFIFFIF